MKVVTNVDTRPQLVKVAAVSSAFKASGKIAASKLYILSTLHLEAIVIIDPLELNTLNLELVKPGGYFV